MTVLQVLSAVAILLGEPSAWRQGAYAGHRLGEPDTSPNGEWSVVADAEVDSPAASCWCLLGAVDYVTGKDSMLGLLVRDELRKTLFLRNGQAISAWNDSPMRTHDEVLSAIHGTIERLES